MDAKLRTSAALLLAVVALGLYWPAGETEFTLDDRDFVAENESLRSPETAWRALVRSFPPAQNGRALYRPVTHASHALEWPWFEGEARGYHAVNALLYAGVVVLLFALLCRYEIAVVWAFIAALVFAVHPVHSEVAASVAGRSELLSLGASLIALLALNRALYPGTERRPRERLAVLPQLVALLAYAVASLSKESGLVTGGAIAVQLALAHRADATRVPLRRAVGDLVPFAIVAIGVVLLRVGVLGRFSPDPSTYAFAFANGFERLATFGAIALEYGRLLVWPEPLQLDLYYERRIGVRASVDPRVVGGWALIATAIAGSIAGTLGSIRRPLNPRSAGAAGVLGAALVLLFLLPVSHVVDIGALMAERFLFAPSAGLALLLGAGLARWGPEGHRARGAIVAAGVALALVSVPTTRARTAEWRSPEALWSALVRDLPDDARGWTSLAGVCMGNNDLESAAAALERAHALAPEDYGVRLNTAELALRSGDLPQAERLLVEMTRSGGVDQRVWLSLATIASRRGQLHIAREHAERALAAQPNFRPTHELVKRLDHELQRRRDYLDRHRAELETSADRMTLDSIAGACRALGDLECERAARRRSRGLPARAGSSEPVGSAEAANERGPTD